MKNKQLLICDSFISVLGVNEGYFHNNDITSTPAIYGDIQRIANEVHVDTGKYVGVVVTPAKVVYKEEWGCPRGGEDVYVLSGNGFFEAGTEATEQAWKDAVEVFILRLKDYFKQETIQIEWDTKIVVRYQ